MAHAAFPQVLSAFLASEARAQTGSSALFSERELKTLELLVDVILPETGTPAASAAGTHRFIDLALSACASDRQREVFKAGLADLQARGFDTANEQQRAALLAARAEQDIALAYDDSFFKILKDYTLVGYFHSEIGATQALAYEKIPGGYEADIPLAPTQKAWAI